MAYYIKEIIFPYLMYKMFWYFSCYIYIYIYVIYIQCNSTWQFLCIGSNVGADHFYLHIRCLDLLIYCRYNTETDISFLSRQISIWQHLSIRSTALQCLMSYYIKIKLKFVLQTWISILSSNLLIIQGVEQLISY